jgi:hypothetical protein
MKRFFAIIPIALLAACQSSPKFEDDTRYTRLAKVVDVHVYSDAERKEAAKAAPRSSNTGVGFGIGVGSGGGFGVMLGMGTSVGGSRSQDLPPQIAQGANRYTVQPLNTTEKIEVNSYTKYQVGDCVKLFSGHPDEYARLFNLKPGEHCN